MKVPQQISVTGICKTTSNVKQANVPALYLAMKSRRGFTLIEILLVLVLLAMTAVAVIATIPPRTGDAIRTQAQSFYQRLQLINEEAVLSGRDFGVRVDDAKARYVFLELTADGWQKLKLHKIPPETRMPDGAALQVKVGGSSWKDKDRLFNPGSLFDDNMFADEKKKKKTESPPQIFVLSSGELTPFTLSFYPQSGDSELDGWRVVAKENGQIVVLAPGEKAHEDK